MVIMPCVRCSPMVLAVRRALAGGGPAGGPAPAGSLLAPPPPLLTSCGVLNLCLSRMRVLATSYF